MNKTEKWQRLDASWSAVITTGEQCTQCYELFCPHCRFGCKKIINMCDTSLVHSWHYFLFEGLFLKNFFISMPQNVTVSARVALTLDKQKEENWKKEDWKRWNKWINNPLRCFIKKKKTTTAKQILMFAGGYNPVCYFYPGASCGLMFSFSSAVAIMAGAPHSVLPLNLM